MNYGSVCSGIEAVTQGWHALGWQPVFFAEIDSAASAVLKHRHPNVPNHGDFTTIQQGDYEPIDILVGGTPCQDFSIAGLRAGMGGERGNLTLEFLRLADRLRPEWVVWENVPGVLSSHSHISPDPCPPDNPMDMEFDGQEVDVEDFYPSDEVHAFNSFLAGLSELGYGWAYVVRDGQYFGVPQRRRRVFVVGHLGDWRRAAAVLFEFHSLSGHPAPSREEGQVAPTIPARSLGGGGLGTDFDCDGGLIQSPFLSSSEGHFDRDDYEQTGRLTPITMSTGQANSEIGIGIGTTLHCGHEAPIVAHVAPPLTRNPYGDHESREDLLVTHALRGEGFDASEDATGRGTPLLVAVPHVDVLPTMQNGADSEAAHSARSGDTKDAYIVPMAFRAAGQDGFTPSGQCPPIASTDGGGAGVPTVCIPIQDQATRHAGTDGSGRQNGKGHGLGVGDPGDPMYTMTGGDQHAVAIHIPDVAMTLTTGGEGERGRIDPTNGDMLAYAINLRGRDGGAMPELDELASLRAASGGSSRSYVGVAGGDTLQYNGIHERTIEANAVEVLRVLREEIGEEAFSKWGTGVLATIQSQKILRPDMHGQSVRREAVAIEGLVDDTLSCAEVDSEGSVCEVSGKEGFGCTPQGWGSHEQRSVELGTYMSLLSQQGAPQGKALRYLWIASEGIGVLREALSKVQEAWRSACSENTSQEDVSGVWYTGSQRRIVREALHAMEARQTARVNGGAGVMAVRRLTPL